MLSLIKIKEARTVNKPNLLLVMLLLPTLALVGCGGDGNSVTPTQQEAVQPVGRGEASSKPKTVEGLTFTLSSPRSVYKVGEGIPLTLTVSNSTDKDIAVYKEGNDFDSGADLGSFDPSGNYESQNVFKRGYFTGAGIKVPDPDKPTVYTPGQVHQFDLTVLGESDAPGKENLRAETYQFVAWMDARLTRDPAPNLGDAVGVSHLEAKPSVLSSDRLSIKIEK